MDSEKSPWLLLPPQNGKNDVDQKLVQAAIEPTRLGLALLLVTSSMAHTQNLPATGPWQGKEIFQKKGCSHCHAIYGEGGAVGPDLGKHKFYGSYLHLAGLMWNHFPQMFTSLRKAGIP